MNRFPPSNPPLRTPLHPALVLLTIDSQPLPSSDILSSLPYPTYVLSCQTQDEETYLVDVLQLPSTSSLPCIGLLSCSGLSVIRSNEGDVVNLRNANRHARLLYTLSPLPQLRVMIAGSSSHCGKTSFTLLLLESLRRRGFNCGYLKPTTQCESESIVTKHCKNNNITTKGSSVVFYKGFTRSYISSQTESSEEMLDSVRADVNGPVFNHCDILLLDGVGYPSVGSITGVSNAQIAAVCEASVLVVTPTGVGHAVDSYDLNASYFKYHNVPVLGAVVNLCERTGFYSVEECYEWCGRSLASKNETLFGALPKFDSMLDLRDSGKEDVWLKQELGGVLQEFEQRVNIEGLLEALKRAARFKGWTPPISNAQVAAAPRAAALRVSSPLKRDRETAATTTMTTTKRTRAEIESEAAQAGAKGG
ncbi:hypothetical protein TrVE_jg859 [Triparma verrucosa]|uniref:Uncharacterized protein n=1 Tax=Triparma verrucosa TaxID=1606542 RepID=A0A9W7F975_9STRA|nr:hypothetical protein TrVE_jg859 [Triparma verrucosa]